MARPPSCRLLAPIVPACDEVVKPGRICQHSSVDKPPCADNAVTLRKEGGEKAVVNEGEAIDVPGVIQVC